VSILPTKGRATIAPIKTISPFWYRRICEITLLISLVILSIYIVVTFWVGDSTTSALLVPLPAAIAALTTAVISFVSYIWAPQSRMHLVAFSNYLLLVLTTGILVELTGSIHSPYIVMLMLLSIFAGMFGNISLAALFVIINGGFAYEVFLGGSLLPRDNLVVIVLALETPLFISYMVWREKATQDSKKTQAFDALAKQLSQVANKSEVVINAIDEGVVAIDGQGIIQLINPAAQEVLGWTKQDAMGLDYHSVIKLIGLNGKELPPEASPIQQVLTSGKPLVNNDLALMTHSNKKILISLVVSPVGQTSNGTSAGAIAVFRDITGEKAEERQKAEFISTASHEMRTPVAAIEGYLGLALNPATAAIDDKARTYLLKAQEATQHLGTLFQDLLTVSRAEDNRLTPKPTVVDVVAFLHEITDSLQQKAQAKGLFLYFKPSTNAAGEEASTNRTLSPVYYSFVDQGHLREVANNLIDNAIKYTKQGSVAVDIKGDDNSVTISVADSGIGIPPEDVAHLFQKFYRIDNSDTREIGGTGLGLYISRRLIEANNGRVWVESALGRGSVFYVQVPRISHEKAAELLETQAAEAQQQATALTKPVVPTAPVAPQPTGPAQAV